MGLILGVLVDRGGRLPGGAPYLTWLAPGLLVASAMQSGTAESTYPVLGPVKGSRQSGHFGGRGRRLPWAGHVW